jgi:hypothetical protein
MLASEDLKATTGIYDAALGAKFNETSGIAIQRRNNQAQTSEFPFRRQPYALAQAHGPDPSGSDPQAFTTPHALARIIGDDGTQEGRESQRSISMNEGRTSPFSMRSMPASTT